MERIFILCLMLALAVGCRNKSYSPLGETVRVAPTSAPGPQTDSFLHFSAYLRATPNPVFPPAILNGFAYFAAGDASTGLELWKTDGTAAGTAMVKDLNPGPEGSAPTELTTVGNLVFFSAEYPGGHSRGIWRTDGTAAGTFPVSYTGTDQNIFVAGTHAVLMPQSAPFTLYGSDGTEAGTLPLGFTASTSRCRSSGGFCYFTAVSGGNVVFMKTDGTAAGTTQVAVLGASFPGVPLVIFNGGLLWDLISTPSQLLRIDLTTGAVTTLSAALPALQSVNAFPGSAAVYLRAGNEVWATDGTAPNTVKLLTLLPQPGLPSFADIAGTMLFTGLDAVQGFGIWKSNGTAVGTTFLKAFPLGAQQLQSDGSTVYFQADDAAGGRELWKSDGSVAGTLQVKDIAPGTLSSDPGLIFSMGGQTYFFATSQDQGLWKTDGTGAGTTLIKKLQVQSGPGTPAAGVYSAALGTLPFGTGKLLATYGQEISLVGSSGPPQRLASFANAVPSAPFPFLTRAIFSVSSLTSPTADLWISDGTVAGTTLVANLGNFGASTQPTISAAATLGNIEVFLVSTQTPTVALQLWKTDGTTAGTQMLKDLGGALNSADISGLVYGGKYYFALNSGVANLWVSDGTVAGTVQALPTYLIAFPLLPFRGKMLFNAQNPVGGAATLYSSDGTVGGTSAVFTGALATEAQQLFAAGTNLFYFVNSLDSKLWSSDGTPAGTADLGVTPGRSVSVFGNLALFSSGADPNNLGLAATDGTSPGTRIVVPAPSSTARQPLFSNPLPAQQFGSTYFCSAQFSYSEPNPVTLATQVVSGRKMGLWRLQAPFSSTTYVSTPSGAQSYLASPLTSSGTWLLGVGGDEFNPYGEIVYLNSF